MSLEYSNFNLQKGFLSTTVEYVNLDGGIVDDIISEGKQVLWTVSRLAGHQYGNCSR
jgi:hypothetical protein